MWGTGTECIKAYVFCVGFAGDFYCIFGCCGLQYVEAIYEFEGIMCFI